MLRHALGCAALAALVALAPAAAVRSGEANPAGTLTLREALAMAAVDGDAVIAARLEAAAADRFWPKAELYTDYSRSDDPAVTTNFRVQQNKLMKLGRFEAENHRTRAGLSYVVFDGGESAGRQRSALAGFSAAMRGSESVRSRAVVAAGNAFLAAVYSERQLAVARAEVGRMESRLDNVRVREKAGRATAADVLQAEYRLERARRDALVAGNAATTYRETLGRLLGRDGRIGEQLAEGPDSPLAGADLPSGPESAEQYALAASPELARARAELAGREAELDERRATRWPRIEAQASTYWDDDSFGRLDDNRRSYLFGVGLTWTAFDGGLRRARILEARHLAEAAEVREREAERLARTGAREAARALEEARAGAAVAARKVAADEAAFQQTEKAHDAGRATFTELLAAQTEVADSRLAEIQAGFDARRAELRLLEATGFWASWNPSR